VSSEMVRVQVARRDESIDDA